VILPELNVNSSVCKLALAAVSWQSKAKHHSLCDSLPFLNIFVFNCQLPTANFSFWL